MRPADHLDSTYTCINNPENHQKTSRMESLEPSTEERPTEEGRKGREVVLAAWTGGREPGQRGRLPLRPGSLPPVRGAHTAWPPFLPSSMGLSSALGSRDSVLLILWRFSGFFRQV